MCSNSFFNRHARFPDFFKKSGILGGVFWFKLLIINY